MKKVLRKLTDGLDPRLMLRMLSVILYMKSFDIDRFSRSGFDVEFDSRNDGNASDRSSGRFPSKYGHQLGVTGQWRISSVSQWWRTASSTARPPSLGPKCCAIRSL